MKLARCYLYLAGMFIAAICFYATSQTASAASLSVFSPPAGQIWPAGSTQTISWVSSSGASANQSGPGVFIDLSLASSTCSSSSLSCAGQGSAPYIIAVNAPNTGSYSWAIPQTMAISYQGPVIVSVSLSDSSAQGVSAPFYLTPPNPYWSSSGLTSPSGGETWAIGSTQPIQWPNSSSSVPSVNINLVPLVLPPSCVGMSCSAASSGIYNIASGVPNSGSYSWNIGSSISGQPLTTGQYIVSVSDVSTGNVIASSAGPFNITAPSQTATTQGSSTPPNISGLSQISGSPGQTVNIIGSGFTPSGNTVMFGPGTYINNLTSSYGTSLEFTVPSYTQPCLPDGDVPCPLAMLLITPGSYGVSVSNANGTSNTLPFEVTGSAPAVVPTGTTTSASLPDGSLVMATGNPTVYLIRSGQLMPFTNSQIFLAYGYKWTQVQSISPAQFSSMGLSDSYVPAPNGSIIKSADNPTIYMVSNGEKSAIPSQAVLTSLGLNVNNVIVLSDQEIQSYPNLPPQS